MSTFVNRHCLALVGTEAGKWGAGAEQPVEQRRLEIVVAECGCLVVANRSGYRRLPGRGNRFLDSGGRQLGSE